MTGAPPAWVRLYCADRPLDSAWLEPLRRQIQAWERDDNPLASLRHVGALPLATPYSAGRLADEKSVLNPFERMCLALAVSHLNSWESWNHRAREQLTQRQAAVDQWTQRYQESHAKALRCIRRWERDKAQQLQDDSFWTPQSVYRLGLRELRGWSRLREWLRENPKASDEQRTSYLAELQHQLGRGFGSASVLDWLARPKQRFLAQHDADVVSHVAALNGLLGALDRTKPYPLFTGADARHHPRYVGYDGPDNSNQPPYRVESRGGRLHVTLQLLVPRGKKLLRENFSFALAPSRQTTDAKILTGEALGVARAQLLDRQTQDRLSRVTSKLGGATLMFNRRQISRRPLSRLSDGDIGDVWFKFSLDVGAEQQAALKRRQSTQRWLSSALHNRARNVKQYAPPSRGFRVIAVHPGVRQIGCAVYCVESVDGPDVTSRHERSFVLSLPGEKPSREVLERRHAADADVYAVQAGLDYLRRVGRVCRAADPERFVEQLLELQKRRAPFGITSAATLTADETKTLNERLSDWKPEGLGAIYERVERDVADVLRRWRRDTRRRTGQELGGKSLWAISYLERVRRALLTWNRHHHPMHQKTRRFDRDACGVVAARLLRHINALKKDRVKTTADLIVQAARGIGRQQGRWQRCAEPCDVIVMRELSRYRTRMDRSRIENSTLMRWCHREMRVAVEQQAEEVGIPVVDTTVMYATTIDATTGQPGVRCHPMTKYEIQRIEMSREYWLAREVTRQKITKPDRLRAGDWVPIDGGEILYVEGRRRNVVINAAQNLAQHYLAGHRNPTMLSAVSLGDQWINAQLGQRLQGALGGCAVLLEPRDHDHYKARVFATASKLAQHLGVTSAHVKALAQDDDEDDDEEVEAAKVLLAAAHERAIFMRDRDGWTRDKTFWQHVRQRSIQHLRASNRLR